MELRKTLTRTFSAVAAGADGLIVEVHNNPACAKCDGMQSLTMPEFDKLMKKINIVKEAQILCAGM